MRTGREKGDTRVNTRNLFQGILMYREAEKSGDGGYFTEGGCFSKDITVCLCVYGNDLVELKKCDLRKKESLIAKVDF